MHGTLTISVIQCNSGSDLNQNLDTLTHQLNTLPKTDVIILPEMAAYRRILSTDPIEKEIIPGPITSFFANHAKQHQSWIIIGSLCEAIPNSPKVYNSTVVLNPNGDVVTTYRKIHLFNCNIPNNILNESTLFESGTTPQTVTIKNFKIGLSICYDLRFPELFQYYTQQNVDLIVVPSSFTHTTGQAHWEPLLKARAIETQCYIAAPNQYGQGGGNIRTYGHSIVIDPWGTILNEGTDSNSDTFTTILTKKKIQDIRRKLPTLTHKQLYNIPINTDNLKQ